MRRLAARALAVTVVAAGVVPLMSGTSWACSCGALTSDPARYVELDESAHWRSVAVKSSSVYVGEVTGSTIDPGPTDSSVDTLRYSVRVVTSLKGGRSGTQVLVTSTSGAACGATLRRGKVLVVDDQIGLCGPSTQERVAERAAVVRRALAGLPSTRVVQPGEWLWRIARTEARVQGPDFRHPSSARVASVVRQIRAANPSLRSTTVLRAGQRLTLPVLR